MLNLGAVRRTPAVIARHHHHYLLSVAFSSAMDGTSVGSKSRRPLATFVRDFSVGAVHLNVDWSQQISGSAQVAHQSRTLHRRGLRRGAGSFRSVGHGVIESSGASPASHDLVR